MNVCLDTLQSYFYSLQHNNKLLMTDDL